MLAFGINLNISGYHFFFGINLKSFCRYQQTRIMLHSRTACCLSALVHNYFIRINRCMRCFKIVFGTFAVNLLDLTSLGIKIIMDPFPIHGSIRLLQCSALLEPDIPGLHITFGPGSQNSFIPLHYLDITFSKKVSAALVICSTVAP